MTSRDIVYVFTRARGDICGRVETTCDYDGFNFTSSSLVCSYM